MYRNTFTKIILLSILTINAWAFIGTSYNRKGVVIKYDTPAPADVKHELGETTKLTGSICVSKYSSIFNKLKCRATLQGNVSIRAYFPDAMTEVTDKLEVKKVGKEYQWSFRTPELQKDSENTLQILVAKDDKRIKKYEKLQAKLNKRILYVENRVQFLEGKEVNDRLISWLNELKGRLERVSKNIDSLIEEDTSVLAQIKIPLQVDNEISFPFYYSSFFSGHKMSLRVPLGSPIEGESIKVEAMSKNLTGKSFWFPEIDEKNDSDDESLNDDGLNQYKLDLMFNSDLKLTSGFTELPFGEKIDLTYESGKISSSDLNNLSLKLSKKLNLHFKIFNKKLELDFPYGEIGYNLPVTKDVVRPISNSNYFESNGSFYKSIDGASFIFHDSLGVLDAETIRIHALSAEDGKEIELDFIKTFVSRDLIEVEILNSSALGDGKYEVSAVIKDLAGNQSFAFKNDFFIDNTAPTISNFYNYPELTRSSNLQISIDVVDFSNTTTYLFHNGVEVYNTVSKFELVNINLKEGENIVEIISIDSVGNKSSLILPVVYLDTTAPTLLSIVPESGKTISTLTPNFKIVSDEKLKKIIINGQETSVDGTTFEQVVNASAEGALNLNIKLEDVAGNLSEYNLSYFVSLKVLNKNLISILPNLQNGKLIVRGSVGASLPLSVIEFDAGFFNREELISNEDGEFEVELDYFKNIKIVGENTKLGKSDTVYMNYDVDTTLSGLVLNTEGNPLPNVRVKLPESGQEGYTDASGSFRIENPIVGDQLLVIDGSTIPNSFLDGKVQYFKTSMKLNIGYTQLNVIDRPIYLSGLVLDDETAVIDDGSPVIVENSNIEGFSIEIPSNTAVFPDGSNSGQISVKKVLANRTTVPVPDFAVPENIYSLEPSGLKFNEPVKLTLPNENELPEGAEVAIISKNSRLGTWDIDGMAKVDQGGQTISTKDGQGITHFSDVYAVPIAPKLYDTNFNRSAGGDVSNGAYKTSIQLPTYKVNGQDLGVSLNYSSNWADPNIVLSSLIDINRNERELKRDIFTGIPFVYSKTHHETIDTWVEPEFIEYEFYSDDIKTEKITKTGIPNKSLLVYAVDMKSKQSGVYPYLLKIGIKLKQLFITSRYTVKRVFYHWKETNTVVEEDSKLIDEIFPQDFSSSFMLNNQSESKNGSGWMLNNEKHIYESSNSKLMLNEAGKMMSYGLNNAVSTVYSSPDNLNSNFLEVGENILKISKTDGSVLEVDSVTGNVLSEEAYDLFTGKIRYNQSLLSGYWTPDGMVLKRVCKYKYTDYRQRVDLAGEILIGDSSLLAIDRNGAIVSIGGGDAEVLKGGVENMPSFQGQTTDPCEEIVGLVCEGNVTEHISDTATCGSVGDSEGKRIKRGYEDGEQPLFNTLTSITKLNSSQVLVSDYGNNLVRLYDLDLDKVSTFAGNGKNTNEGDGGKASDASIFHPVDTEVGPDGKVYILSESGLVRMVSKDGPNGEYRNITTYAGDMGEFENSNFTHRLKLFLNKPQGLEIDHNRGLMYIADTGNHRIVRINMANGVAETVAGSGACDSLDRENVSAVNMSICSPETISLDSVGNIIFLDSKFNKVKKIHLYDNDGNSSDKRIYLSDNGDGSFIEKKSDATFLRSLRNGTIEKYDASGRVIEVVDLSGNREELEYEGDKLSRFIDSKGGVTEYYYNYSGYLSKIVDPVGRETYFDISNGLLTRVTFPDSSVRKFNYDGNLISSEVNKLNNTTNVEYNQWGRVEKVIDSMGNEHIINDVLSNNLDSSFVNGGSGDFVDFDDVSTVEVSSNDQNNYYLKYDYSGFVTNVLRDDGSSTKVEYNTSGQVSKITNEKGELKSFSYDAVTGDLISSSSSNGNDINYQYDSFGNIISVDKNGSVVLEFIYDDKNRLIQKNNVLSNIVENFTHSSDGLLLLHELNTGETAQFTYDEFGNVSERVGTSGKKVGYIRDVAGNIAKIIDSGNEVYSREYDVFNRLIKVTSPLGEETHYEYDLEGNLFKITDSNLNTTEFLYDKLGRLVKKTEPGNKVTLKEYNNKNRITWEKTASGVVKKYSYNEFGKLVRKELPDNVYEYYYDENDNLKSIKDNNTQVHFDYVDVNDEYKISSTETEGYSDLYNLPTDEISYSYNSLGQRVGMSFFEGSFSYNFNELNQLENVINHKSEVFDFSYSGTGKLISSRTPASLSEINYEDGKVKELSHLKVSDSTKIRNISFDYDNNGKLSSILNNGSLLSISYDANGQLVNAGDESFVYDSLGNRISDAYGSYQYDSFKEKLIEDWRYLYYYDSAGNVSSKIEKETNDLTQYVYNSENQLISVLFYRNGSTLEKTSNYFYDAIGRRVKKTVENGSGSTNRFYVYDGNDLLKVYGDDGVLGIFTHSNLRIDDVLAVDVTSHGVDTKIAKNVGSYFYIKDHLGSIVDIVDKDSNVIQRFKYSAFGEILSVRDGSGNSLNENSIRNMFFTFTGREFDQETGLYNFRARYYDPASSRFMQKDPDSGKIEIPSTVVNKYIYAINDPFSFIDPTGESIFSDGGFIGDLVFAIIAIVVIAGTGGGGAAFFGAIKAVGAAALGSAVAAGLMTLGGGGDFADNFHTVFRVTIMFMTMSAVFHAAAGHTVTAGANTWFSGYVEGSGPLFGQSAGLTVGPATTFSNATLTSGAEAGGALGAHEFGHVVQFWGHSLISGLSVSDNSGGNAVSRTYLSYGIVNLPGVFSSTIPQEKLISSLMKPFW
ncbi:RHS repeat-associated core domain protein [Bacteriovorax sp. BAL6_X]|uniref:RHS repeat-associated core domain-containing protein n=1 Tax=Bacteriovorax sp. BAL6_X TaxID=1201290 RepID=UPI000386CC4B|nr:RHS repeat-associated core domain-containing protein [Bacteriovorax sp. BAL6_X]EPZ50892.1 RHS repeat-associated core domain protein [Bacteriovorax sp. BAL6_X]